MFKKNPTRWGGAALMLGALMFMLTKARGYIDPDDSLLGYFMVVGFGAWIVGLAALYFRYAPIAGRLGKAGLITAILGILSLAVGHLYSFLLPVELFGLIILGSLALALGALLFGVAALRKKLLPRYWRFLPLLTGLIGFSWFFFGSNESGLLTFTFMFFRTLFAFGWLLIGYVLWSDREETAESPVRTAGLH